MRRKLLIIPVAIAAALVIAMVILGDT